MLRSPRTRLVAALLLVASCTSDAGSPLDPGAASSTISDAAHAGSVPGFYFLPPMVREPVYSGSFDAGVAPLVEICELAHGACSVTIAQWTIGTGLSVNASAEHYQVNWHTRQYNLDPARRYRISVFVGSLRLGYADVEVLRSGRDFRGVDRNALVPVVNGSTLPIKFRIETGVVAQVIVAPAAAEVPVGGTQAYTATLLNLHGVPITGPAVSWASSDSAVATVDAGGTATGVAVGLASIIATAQAVSGSAGLLVINRNEPPVAAPDTFDAIGNVTVPVAAPGVLANDTDPDGNPLSALAGTFATAAGGTFTLNADGGFTYRSAPGFIGEDRVAYGVTDGLEVDSSTITLVVATRVWYVSNDAAAPGDGRDVAPFATLKAAEGAASAGETILVLRGDGTSAGLDEGIVLKAGQSLVGQGIGTPLSVPLNGGSIVLLAPGGTPSLTRTTAGSAITLAAGNTVRGMDVSSTAGAGMQGSGFGTLTVDGVSVHAVGGPSLDLSVGTAAASFGALSSAGSTTSGLRLVDVAGALQASDGNVSGAAGTAVEVSGGSGDVSYGGNVASVGPRPVSVTGRTGGTVTLAGTIASTGQGILVQGNSGGLTAFTGSSKSLATGSAPGVELASNTGAHIHFAGGGLAIGTTSGDAFRASGGGTVTVTGAGNTLVASAGGAALRVQNVAIGGSGLTFRSVSAAAGAHGVVLEGTGGGGGLQVTGSGPAGSGGLIDGTTGDAVRLNGVQGVALTSMVIRASAGSGITGTDVHGFSLTGSEVLDSGDDPLLDEAGIRFDGLTGVATIGASEVAGSIRDNVRIANGSGSLTLTVTGSTFRDNHAASGSDGLRLTASGTAQVTANVSGSHFLRHRATGVSASTSGAGVLHIDVTGGSLRDNAVGVNLIHGSTGALTFAVNGIPTIVGHASSPINVNRLGTAGVGSVFSGTIHGNVIGTAGVPGSGASSGSGIRVVSNGVGGALTVAVTGNTIREVTEFGLQVLARDGSSTINATVTGNDIVVSSLFGIDGIRMEAGALSTDAVTICGVVTGNVAAGPVRGIRLRQRFVGTTFRLAGYGGSPTDNAAVASFLTGTNTASSAAADHGGAGFQGVGSCPAP